MLSKVYKKKVAVNRINIDVRRGDIYGFIGRNGAGKTTLIRMILGVICPTEGRVELFGGENPDTARKKIGSSVENPCLYMWMNVEQNLEAHRILLGIKDKSVVDSLIKRVGLDVARKKKAGNLSLGMKQRLVIALSLIGNPEFLILDEPINGLDPSGIKEFRDLIKNLNQKYGVTVFISSHLLSELSKFATRYGIMEDGKLIEEFSSTELNERSEPSLLIKVDNIKRSIEIIEKDLGTKNYKIRDDSTIELFENGEKPGEINRLLSSNGIIVEAISKNQVDLESYFLKIAGVNKDL
jgi:ABC-2 type transport system ATP-binding protein